jgi:hypothetical protein
MSKNLKKFFLKSPNFSTKWNNYFPIYEEIFKKFYKKNITFVEIGVGLGGSLFMWRNFFGNNSRIIGVDLNPKALELKKKGFEIFIGDQQNKNFWNNFYRRIGKVDIVLDDGGHKNLQQISTVYYSLPYVKDDGMIVIEDTMTSYLKKGFGNPSIHSFINFSYKIIDLIHARNLLLKKKSNYISKSIYQVRYFESIVVFDINKKKCINNSLVYNKKNFQNFDDYRHRGNSIRFFNYLQSHKYFKYINFTIRLIKFFGYRNIFFYIYEKVKLHWLFHKIRCK